MFEICAGGKTIGSAGLWIEPDRKMGFKTEIDQYGEGSEKGERTVIK